MKQFFRVNRNFPLAIFVLLLIAVQSKTNLLAKNKFYDDCEAQPTCSSCLAKPSCGWCYSEGLCKYGNELGPNGGGCPYDSWETSGCRKVNCNEVSKMMPCITQPGCVWCVPDSPSDKKCLSENEIYGQQCKKSIGFKDFLKRPDLVKQSVSLERFNDNLEQLNSGTLADQADLDNALNNLAKTTSNSNNFLKQLKLYFSLNNREKPEKFDSISNPSGAFQYQVDTINQKPTNVERPIKDFTLLQNFNFTMIAKLSKLAKAQFLTVSKHAAFEILRNQFKIGVGGTVELTSNYHGPKYYLYLEKIAAEKWVSYLQNSGVDQKQLYASLHIRKEQLLDEIRDAVLAQTRQSFLYRVNFDSLVINTMYFKYSVWGKLNGTDLTIRSYLNSTVLIFNQMEFFGSGTNFESVLVHNSDLFSSTKLLRKNSFFSKVESNYFVIKKLPPGIHKFYVAFKTDFTVDKLNVNNKVSLNAIELPYSAKIIKNERSFKYPKYFATEGSFTIEEVSFQVNLGDSSDSLASYISQEQKDKPKQDNPGKKKKKHKKKKKKSKPKRLSPNEPEIVDIKTDNYLIIYHVSSQNLAKNLFLKLVVKDKNNSQLPNLFSTHALYTPSLGSVKNMNGLALLALTADKYQFSLEGKFIFDKGIGERLAPLRRRSNRSASSRKIFDDVIYFLQKNKVKSSKLRKRTKDEEDDDEEKAKKKKEHDVQKKLKKEEKKKLKEEKKKNHEEEKKKNHEEEKKKNHELMKNMTPEQKKKFKEEKKKKKEEEKKKKKKKKDEKKKKKKAQTDQQIDPAPVSPKSTSPLPTKPVKPQKSVLKKKPIVINHDASKINDDFFDQVDDKSSEKLDVRNILRHMKLYEDVGKETSTDIHKQLRYKTLFTPEDIGEIMLIKLPISSMIFSLSYKNLLIIKGNNELNEIPRMRRLIKIFSDKNVVFHYKVLLTFGVPCEIKFRLYINGKHEGLGNLLVSNEMMVNHDVVFTKRMTPGEYTVEMLYISGNSAETNMLANEWDIIALNILILDIE